MNLARKILVTTLALFVLAPSAWAGLDILVTNDDGIGSAGIQTLAAALTAAGHNVTVVAPAEQQSGKGGSINTSVFTQDFIPIVRIADNQWAVSGSPSDAVNAAFNIILRDNPPDLVVSGLNEGQNLGQLTGNTSGTIGAALRASLGFGVPAIAGSVGILFEESQLDPEFPSTTAAYGPSAAVIVDLVGAIEASRFPRHTKVLNVNFPVPFEAWEGTEITRLAAEADLELPFFDVTEGFPPFFPQIPVAPPCSAVPVGGACLASIGVVFDDNPDPLKGADTDAFNANKISVTPMSGDMTAGLFGLFDSYKLLTDAGLH